MNIQLAQQEQKEINEGLARVACLAKLPPDPMSWIGLKFKFIWAEEKYEPILILGTITAVQFTQLELVFYVSTPEFGRSQKGAGPKLHYLKFVEFGEDNALDPHWVAVGESDIGKGDSEDARGLMEFFITNV